MNSHLPAEVVNDEWLEQEPLGEFRTVRRVKKVKVVVGGKAWIVTLPAFEERAIIEHSY